MPYSELIKNFERIRDYMREFYVYGFKSRSEYTQKSARSYDDERRRIESWLGDYMHFRISSEAKNVFLSIDSRLTQHNPLYQAWKAKSFTDKDITLHFILFDILHDPKIALNIYTLIPRIDEYFERFDTPMVFDLSTIRKKLKEYTEEGIIRAEKRGKILYYRRAESTVLPSDELLDFFSETAPCGVVGSFLLDKKAPHDSLFAFKHHYITAALDSEVLAGIFDAMGEKRSIRIENHGRRGQTQTLRAVPLEVRISVRSGRQYLMAYVQEYARITSLRIDGISNVKAGEVIPDFDALRVRLHGMEAHIWGVSTRGRPGRETETISFTVCYREDEPYIPQRLAREKRIGRVDHPGPGLCRFSAEVYDPLELFPWIRTFLCRITEFRCSDPEIERRFFSDLKELCALYGVDEEAVT